MVGHSGTLVRNMPASKDFGQTARSIQLDPGPVDRILQVAVGLPNSRADWKAIRSFSGWQESELASPPLLREPGCSCRHHVPGSHMPLGDGPQDGVGVRERSHGTPLEPTQPPKPSSTPKSSSAAGAAFTDTDDQLVPCDIIGPRVKHSVRKPIVGHDSQYQIAESPRRQF